MSNGEAFEFSPEAWCAAGWKTESFRSPQYLLMYIKFHRIHMIYWHVMSHKLKQ